MKKICLVLLLLLPVVVNAQRSTTNPRSATAQKATGTQKESEKGTTKYEDLVSKSGVVFTTYTYPMGEVLLPWSVSSSSYTEKISFSIEKIVIDNIGISYLQVTHRGYDEISSAMVEETNVKEWYNALIKMKEICKNPVPEGASAKYYYLNPDGIVMTYQKGWRIQLEKITKDNFPADNIDPLITKLQEVIQKFDTIR